MAKRLPLCRMPLEELTAKVRNEANSLRQEAEQLFRALNERKLSRSVPIEEQLELAESFVRLEDHAFDQWCYSLAVLREELDRATALRHHRLIRTLRHGMAGALACWGGTHRG